MARSTDGGGEVSAADTTAGLRFSLFSSDRGRLTKRIVSIPKGGIDTIEGGKMWRATVKTVTLRTLNEFPAMLTGLGIDQALGYGISKNGDCRVVTAKVIGKLRARDGVTTREDINFEWPVGPGILFLDYDAPKTGNVMTPEEFLSAIYKIVPQIPEAPHLLIPSSSSCIYDRATGAEIRGWRSSHLYVVVADARDIPRAGKSVFERTWLHGHGRYDVGARGALARSLIDAAVFQPSRLDFGGAVDCGEGLEKRWPGLAVRGGATPLDTRLIRDLEHAEKEELQSLQKAARAAVAPQVRKKRQQAKALCIDGAMKAGATPEQAKRTVDAAFRGRTQSVLKAEFVLTTGDGQQITVAEVKRDPNRWNKGYFLDPVEPNESRRHAAQAHLLGGDSHLWAFGHGGRRYELEVEGPMRVEGEIAADAVTSKRVAEGGLTW